MRPHALPLLAAALFLALVVGCGEIKVQAQDAADAKPDTGTATDLAPDPGGETAAQPDVAAGETVVTPDAGPECETDFDCAGMKGKTPCKIPKCKAGKCELSFRKEGEACVDPFDEPGECQQSACSLDGQCVKGNKKDGAVCGVGACGKKCAVGLCVAATPGDYDDGNPCTEDFCDQGKAVVYNPITKLDPGACDDGDKCTVEDACIEGKCKGKINPCNDGLDCTLDTCFSDKGCVYTPNNQKCSDGNPCTKDGCDLAKGCTVVGNEIGACDDGNDCTEKDLCSGGSCQGQASASKCGCVAAADCDKFNDKLNECQGTYLCDAGKKACVLDPKTVVKCPSDKDTACAKNACNAKTGKCELTPLPDGKECTDANKCTKTAACKTGQCQGKEAVNCDDQNACTADSCDPVKGCTHQPLAAPCDDLNKCTTGDVCSTGVCAGTKKPCDDKVACTFDACDPATGNCTNQPDNAPCEDGNPCTLNKCDAAKGCAVTPNDGAGCDDGNPCTSPDKCAGTICTGTNACECKADTDCNDNNPCTQDKCNSGKCAVTNADGAACSTADKCQQPNSGVCKTGVCTSGNKPVVCASDACNTGVCNPGTGKCETVAKGDGTPCDADKNPCTANDQCKAGKCLVGAAVVCPSEPCFDGVCEANAGSATGYQCGKKFKAPGTMCDDGLFCTEPGKCDTAGKCVAGPKKVCTSPSGSGTNPCVVGVCDEALKQCGYGPAPAGTGCDDGNVCTTGDSCNTGGGCQPGKPMPPATGCDDGQPCTAGEQCDMNGQCQPGKPTPGAPCNDGMYCTEGETCNEQNQCVGGKPKPCPPGPNKCIAGVCNEAYDKCDLAPVQTCCMASADCNDGKPCTADACQASNNYCAYKPIDGCCNPILYENTFDDGKLKELTIANGTGQHFLGWQLLAKSPQYVSPYAALYYGDAAKKNFNFVNPDGSNKNTGNFALPTTLMPKSPGLYLEFDLWVDTEIGAQYDDLTVTAHPIGSMPPQVLWTKNPSKAGPDVMVVANLPAKTWTKQKVSLDKFAGMLVTIGFAFDSIDAVGNQGEGIYIDNLRLVGPQCGGGPPQG